MIEAVSEAEELVRSGLAPHWRDRTHSLYGHPYDEANTLRRSDGSRLCRTCHRAAGRRWYAERGAAARKGRRRAAAQKRIS
jgi:hypothetical protein